MGGAGKKSADARWAERVVIAVVAVMAPFAMSGCHSSARRQSAAGPAYQFPVQGTVISADAPANSIVLAHGAIPGFMEAMTMEYRVDDPAALGEMHPGDRIAATILADKSDDGPVNLRLHDIVIVGQARPDYKPPVVYHVPQPGETVPDFKLLNQSGKTIHMEQFRGKVIAMTFIYTRCPLADYCPRMSRNFATMDAALEKDPKLYAKTHLLSVSFDPTYDTPKVLKSYGGAYTGKYVNETFRHWDFAAPHGAELLAMEKWFAVGVTPGQNGTLQHSLATTVIGKDGKVIAFYPTKDWSVPQVLAQMEDAAKG